jgi:hypothetical protein
MLYLEMIAFCSVIRKNTLSGNNVELLKVKPGGTYINYWTLNGYYYPRADKSASN